MIKPGDYVYYKKKNTIHKVLEYSDDTCGDGCCEGYLLSGTNVWAWESDIFLIQNEPDNCPWCGVSLFGDPIPENIRHHYSPPYYWRREMEIEYQDKYDGVWEYRCPDCEKTWPSEVQILRGEK